MAGGKTVVPHMTKEELREDPVLERIQKTISFAERHSRWLIGGAVLVVAVIVGLSLLHRAQVRGEREAARLLMDAQASFLQNNLPAAESQFQQIIDSYGGTSAGVAARIYMGDVLRALDRPEEALRMYEQAAGKADDPLLETGAARGRAAAYEDLGRFAEASEAYERAAASAPFLQADDLVAAGRTALRAGDAARAKTILEQARDKVQGDRRSELALLLAKAEAATR